MTIPQLSRKIKSPQSWRNKKKKYFINKGGGRSSWQGTNKTGGFNRPNFDFLHNKKFIKTAAVIFLAAVVFIFVQFIWISRNLPDPNKLIERQVAQSTKIYDRTGETILYEISGDQKRTLVDLKDIPDNVKNATISIEDKDFYKHKGFSIWAIFRTAVTDVLFGKKAGASTLTQQFVKNSVLTNEKTFTRKIKEVILAYRLEKKFSKDEILQMYLNEIPYGSTAYGVEAASQKYFGKSVKQVNLAEAAILAALPQAPSRYSPYGPNKDLLLARQRYILDLMAKYNYISKDDAEVAKAEKVNFKEQGDNMTAPHFVMYVKELLAEKYGDKMIEQDGLKIYTTLDLYKQKIAEEVINERAPSNAAKYQANNAALVSIDPKTGQVLAMVGSKDYFNEEIDGQVNVVLQPRQPGSSFKPIVYAASFIKGYTPDTVLYDVVTNFSTDPANPYEPHNYDNKEHGPVTIRQALAGSLNIPAVKAIYLTGIENVLNLATGLGYTTFQDKSRFGLSLVLGGGEVKLLEHTNAFSAFAREGDLQPVSMILKVEDKNGKVIEEFKENKTKVLDGNIARQMNNILSDNAARAYVFGEKNYLTLSNRPVAAKTGTTNDYHDAWTIGYTPSIVTGVWVGNSDNKAMKRGADGSVVAAPIWHDYMERVLGNTPAENFNAPEIVKTGKPVLDGNIEGTVTVKIDKYTGMLATDSTPAEYIEEKQYRQVHDILYYVNKDDPRGPAPQDPRNDPQFELWESRVQAWAQKQGITSTPLPTDTDNIHLSENKPVLNITYPTDNQTITDPQFAVTIGATAPRGINRIEYYIDGNLVDTVTAYPFGLKKQMSFLNNGVHTLTAKACDDVDNCTEQKINFSLALPNNPINKDISIGLNRPSQEVTLRSSDFPFLLKASVSNTNQIVKVAFYLEASSGDEKQLAIVQPQGNSAAATWTAPPDPGVYKVYAEAIGWNGQIAQSQSIKVIYK